MISDRQNRFYWGLWGKAKAALSLNPQPSTTEWDLKRHELHVRAIGRDKSHYDLTNREFDRVIAVQAISRRMFLGLEIGELGADELRKVMIALREHERRQAEPAPLPGKCCMPGPHYESECHTAEMLMAMESQATSAPNDRSERPLAARKGTE
jgi:hypothetical protein